MASTTSHLHHSDPHVSYMNPSFSQSSFKVMAGHNFSKHLVWEGYWTKLRSYYCSKSCFCYWYLSSPSFTTFSKCFLKYSWLKILCLFLAHTYWFDISVHYKRITMISLITICHCTKLLSLHLNNSGVRGTDPSAVENPCITYSQPSIYMVPPFSRSIIFLILYL